MKKEFDVDLPNFTIEKASENITTVPKEIKRNI